MQARDCFVIIINILLLLFLNSYILKVIQISLEVRGPYLFSLPQTENKIAFNYAQ